MSNGIVEERERLLVDGVPLAVRSWGDPDGRPLLFLHALGHVASGAWLREAGPLLAARGFRVVAPDQPGFGESPALAPEDYGVARLARLARALLDALEIEWCLLAGHSWGGTIGVELAATAPERVEALVLLDSGHADYADQPGARPEATLAERIAAAEPLSLPSWEALVEELRGEARRWDDALPELMRPGVRANGAGITGVDPVVRAAALHGAIKARVSDRWPALAAAGLPVLLLLATEPEEARERNAADAKRFAAAVPQARVVSVEGAGHDLLVDAGPRIAAAIADFAG